MPKSFRTICKEVNWYYDYRGRYEFCLAPLNYYKRQKIKFNLRLNRGLYKLDNCRVIKICNKSVTKYITKLNISYNLITQLPLQIDHLQFLTHLNLSGNQLTNLPSSICNLKAIMRLGLSHNKLTKLPLNIGNLKSLTYINLFGNRLTNDYITYIRSLLPNCSVR